MSKHLLVMAGGTGGHIFPGLAVAHAMEQRGWRISWLGTPGGMEKKLVPQDRFPLHVIAFEGVVGQGLKAKLGLPLRLFQAVFKAKRLLQQLKPDVVIGMGGYPTVPGGLAAYRMGIPLLIHQSDAIAGLANKLLARFADSVLVGFPNVFASMDSRRSVTGNPIRADFSTFPGVEIRTSQRHGPLKILVMGGSRGADAINKVMPEAMNLIPMAQRPELLHQTGHGAGEKTRARYVELGISSAKVVDFLDDTATALSACDLFIGRSGASTVTELATLGVASLLIPYPHHKDRQQWHNANVLASVKAASILEQSELSAARLADMVLALDRTQCLAMAERALTVARPMATDDICDQIETVVAQRQRGVQA